MKKRIISLVLIVLLAASSEKIVKGEVVDKTFSPAYVRTALIPICISNGKTMTTRLIPYVYRYPDTWTITISGPGEGGKTETATYRVTQEVFDAVPLGAEFSIKQKWSRKNRSITGNLLKIRIGRVAQKNDKLPELWGSAGGGGGASIAERFSLKRRREYKRSGGRWKRGSG